jgi:hypothetical protein
VPGVINLYDAASANVGPADVTLVGNTTGTIKGSLIIDPSNPLITFIKTGGVLAADTYTATLVSGVNAFKDAFGNLLGGGSNFVFTLPVAASSAVVVSVPDFARGPDATDPINIPNNSTSGVPITLSNGSGVTDGTFVLQYNANLLTITGGVVNPALVGATFTVTPSGSGTSAQATIVFHSPTALAAGTVRLGGLTATVPNNAPYKSKDLLHFSSVSLNSGGIAAIGDDGLHIVAYFGDTSGDGTYSGLDASLASRVASSQDSGFAAYRLADPVIIADINANNRIDGADASFIAQVAGGGSVSRIPPIPSPAPVIVPGGPDPTLSIPADLKAEPGGVVVVPVNLDTAMPPGSTGLTEADLALTFDPNVFTVAGSDITLGTLPSSGSGWTLTSSINPVTGEIGINLYSTTPLTTTAGGSLVTIAFHVKPTVPAGMTPIHLAAEVNPSGRQLIRTSLDDAQGGLTLHPVPTSAATDAGMDGLVNLVDEAPARSAPRLADPVGLLGNPGVSSSDSLTDSPASNAVPPEPSALDQFFQGLASRSFAEPLVRTSLERLDAALASLLETAALPSASAVLPLPSERDLDPMRGAPEWLPDLARALLDRTPGSRPSDGAAADVPLAVEEDAKVADVFGWEDAATWGAAAHSLGDDPAP